MIRYQLVALLISIIPFFACSISNAEKENCDYITKNFHHRIDSILFNEYHSTDTASVYSSILRSFLVNNDKAIFNTLKGVEYSNSEERALFFNDSLSGKPNISLSSPCYLSLFETINTSPTEFSIVYIDKAGNSSDVLASDLNREIFKFLSEDEDWLKNETNRRIIAFHLFLLAKNVE